MTIKSFNLTGVQEALKALSFFLYMVLLWHKRILGSETFDCAAKSRSSTNCLAKMHLVFFHALLFFPLPSHAECKIYFTRTAVSREVSASL